MAVLDTGVAYENRGRFRRAPDLAGTRFVPGWDFVDDDAHPNEEPVPVRPGHGTHITGIIAQTTGNRLGAAGIAPAARIMPIRVLRPDVSGSARTIARGLRFAADHGADVANLSLAGAHGTPALEDAIDYATSRGVTVVASAGNGGGTSIGHPAAYPRVIAVGAVTRLKRRAPYSNYGRELDIVAPAGDAESPDIGDGSADGVLQQTLRHGPASFCFCFMASTSAAAAQVSGVAALVVGSGRARRPAAVRSALLSSAEDLGRPGRDRLYGAGLLQAAGAVGATDGVAARDRAGSGDGSRWYVWAGIALVLVLALTVGLRLARSRRKAAGP